MTEQGNRGSNGRWLKGTTGNAAGRGMTNRQRISERLLADLATVWETHGETVLARLAVDEPGKLATIAYGLLPRDVFISVAPSTPGNLAPEEWAVMVDLVRLIRASAPAGADAMPSDLAPALEDAVRAHFAKPVESS
jgi:hypothetical protein